jgi:hypothetical protein
MKYLCIFFLTFCSIRSSGSVEIKNADAQENNLFWNEVREHLPKYKKAFKHYKDLRMELIFTKIERNIFQKAEFTTYHYGDSVSYFYPASAVKLPLAVFAMEKIRQIPGITSGSALVLDSTVFCNGYRYYNSFYLFRRAMKDMSLQEFAKSIGRDPSVILQLNPSLGEKELIKKNTYIRVEKQKLPPSLRYLISVMLIYSDNTAYNKIYEFTQPDFINSRFSTLGYRNSRIVRRFAACSEQDQMITRAFRIEDPETNQSILTEKEKQQKSVTVLQSKGITAGKKQANDAGKKTRGGKNFSMSNKMPLNELNRFLVDLVFNHQSDQFVLPENDWSSLIRWLGTYPSEVNVHYDTTGRNVHDGITNYLFSGQQKVNGPVKSRIINIVGQAYGFTTDCAYYFDPETKVEFFLSARMYTNRDKTVGDDKYEYVNIAFPFMRDLGQQIIKMETARPKEVLPLFAEMISVFNQ